MLNINTMSPIEILLVGGTLCILVYIIFSLMEEISDNVAQQNTAENHGEAK